MREDRQRRMTDVTDILPRNFPGTLFCGPDGHLYFNVGSGNSRPIVRVEPNALKEVGRFGEASSWLSNTTTSSVLLGWLGMVVGLRLVRPGRLPADGLASSTMSGLLRADDMSYVWGAGQTVTEAPGARRHRWAVGEGFGEGWLLGSGTSTEPRQPRPLSAPGRSHRSATTPHRPDTRRHLREGGDLHAGGHRERRYRLLPATPVGSPTTPPTTASSSR